MVRRLSRLITRSIGIPSVGPISTSVAMPRAGARQEYDDDVLQSRDSFVACEYDNRAAAFVLKVEPADLSAGYQGSSRIAARAFATAHMHESTNTYASLTWRRSRSRRERASGPLADCQLPGRLGSAAIPARLSSTPVTSERELDTNWTQLSSTSAAGRELRSVWVRWAPGSNPGHADCFLPALTEDLAYKKGPKCGAFHCPFGCRRRDSNPRHADYDSAALTD